MFYEVWKQKCQTPRRPESYGRCSRAAVPVCAWFQTNFIFTVITVDLNTEKYLKTFYFNALCSLWLHNALKPIIKPIIKEPYCFPTTHSSGSLTVSRLIMSVVCAKIASFVSVYHLITISNPLKGLKIHLHLSFSISAFLPSFPSLLTFLITICLLKVHLNLEKISETTEAF